MSFKWEKEAVLSLTIVAKAAEMLEVNVRGIINQQTKESFRDVVTEHDVLIENFIKNELAGNEYTIIGEESINTHHAADKNTPVWCIDPIDGTANYVNGITWYAVSIGLKDGEKFPVGTVILPAVKEIFFISDQGTAFLNGKKLTVVNNSITQSLIAVSFSGKAFNSDNRKKEFDVFGELNDSSRGCLRTGSAAVNICYVACGRLHAAVGFAAKIWDVAGAFAIATAAGCTLYVEWLSDNRLNYLIGDSTITAEYLTIFNELVIKKNIDTG